MFAKLWTVLGMGHRLFCLFEPQIEVLWSKAEPDFHFWSIIDRSPGFPK
jgi:hypothetical protein